MILTVTLNPAVDKTVYISNFFVNQVNRVENVIMDPGGKGINVSKSVQALGGETICLGIVGGETGKYLELALDEMGIRHDMVTVNSPTRTNTKIVDMVCGTNTDINEPGAKIENDVLDAVWCKILSLANAGDTVIFAGKNPPGVPVGLIAEWTGALNQKGVRVCVDTVGEAMKCAISRKPAIIKPNKEELEELIGHPLDSECEILQAAKKLNECGVELVAVSLGGDGAIIVTKEAALRVHVPKVNVISTVGAGDSMMAALAYYSQSGYPVEEVARYAAAVSAATVQVEGSKPAGMEQILPLLEKIKIEYM